jgi:hypothetical protein
MSKKAKKLDNGEIQVCIGSNDLDYLAYLLEVSISPDISELLQTVLTKYDIRQLKSYSYKIRGVSHSLQFKDDIQKLKDLSLPYRDKKLAIHIVNVFLEAVTRHKPSGKQAVNTKLDKKVRALLVQSKAVPSANFLFQLWEEKKYAKEIQGKLRHTSGSSYGGGSYYSINDLWPIKMLYRIIDILLWPIYWLFSSTDDYNYGQSMNQKLTDRSGRSVSGDSAMTSSSHLDKFR